MTIETAGSANLASQIDLAVVKKAQEVSEQQGEAAVALIEDAAQIAKASRGAVSAAPGPGETGGNVDVTA